MIIKINYGNGNKTVQRVSYNPESLRTSPEEHKKFKEAYDKYMATDELELYCKNISDQKKAEYEERTRLLIEHIEMLANADTNKNKPTANE